MAALNAEDLNKIFDLVDEATVEALQIREFSDDDIEKTAKMIATTFREAVQQKVTPSPKGEKTIKAAQQPRMKVSGPPQIPSARSYVKKQRQEKRQDERLKKVPIYFLK